MNDAEDFIEWNLNKFTASDLAAVPEPTASLALLLMLAWYGIALNRRALQSPETV